MSYNQIKKRKSIFKDAFPQLQVEYGARTRILKKYLVSKIIKHQ